MNMKKYNHDHDCPFEAFITNLGKYNEGDLIGEWVKFPTTSEELQNVFKRIGIGSTDEFGQPYEEWFITDYDVYVDGLTAHHFGYSSGEYANLDELNYFASLLEEMSDIEYEHYSAILDEGSYADNLQDLINLTFNIDSFEVLPDVQNDYDLGYYYLEEAGIYDLSKLGNLESYIDYERFGRDVALEEGGVFTDYGYVCERDSTEIVYMGIEDIPEEYIVTKFNDNQLTVELPSKEYNIDVLLGYVYDENGMHSDPIRFENTADNISKFIMHNQTNPTVVTDELDQFVVSSTFGGFLDRVSNPIKREEILESILPYQLGDKEVTFFPINELNANIDNKYQIEVHLNSDNDFDYTIYDKDLTLIDGGVLINMQSLDSVPTSIFNEIAKMHNLEINGGINMQEQLNDNVWIYLNNDSFDGHTFKSKEYVRADGTTNQTELRGVTTNIMIDDMIYKAQFSIPDYSISEVKNKDGIVNENASKFPLDADIKKKVNLSYQDAEGKWINEEVRLTGSQISDYRNDYKEHMKQVNILKDEEVKIDAVELATKIDSFAKDYDHYNYQDSEQYPGYNLDQTISDIKRGRLDGVKELLNEASKEDYMKQEVQELLQEINKYDEQYKHEQELSQQMKHSGMKM